MKLIGNMVIKQEEQIQELQARCDYLVSKDLRPNLVIHGIIEGKEEKYSELIGKIDQFFKNQMNIQDEIQILDAYRKGYKGDRPIVIRLQHPNDKAIIFANASLLKDKRNIRKKLFSVQDEQDPKTSENRRVLQGPPERE